MDANDLSMHLLKDEQTLFPHISPDGRRHGPKRSGVVAVFWYCGESD